MKVCLYALLFLLSVVQGGEIAACECWLKGSFETVSIRAPLVALVKISALSSGKNRYGRTAALTAEVLQVYRGDETRKQITIWGSTGKDCRPLITQFAAGKTYKIALYAGDDGFEKPGDYMISVCGMHWEEAAP